MKRIRTIGLGVVAGIGMITGAVFGQDDGTPIVFDPGVIVDQFERAVLGKLAIDGHGNVYVSTEQGGHGRIDFNRSTDYGATFEQPYRTLGGVGALYHAIGANGTGDVYVVWEDYRAGMHVFINASNDGGLTFNGEMRVDNAPSAAQPEVAADDAGRVFVSHAGYDKIVRVAVSADRGGTFSHHLVGGSYSGNMTDIATNGEGNVYVVFSNPNSTRDFYFNRSLDGGSTWDTAIQLESFGSYYNWAQCPKVAADGDNVYVAWYGNYGDGWDAYLVKSEDAGVSFGPPTLVSVETRPGGTSPLLAVDGNIVIVVWALPGEAWYAVSTDAGATFAPAQNATDGYATGLAASGGLVYASYQPFDDPTVVGFALGVVQSNVVFVDIKPGSCPNPLNLGSRGYIPMAVLATDDFDVTQIDIASIVLARADGVAGFALPHEGPPGPHSVYEDAGTPFEGDACECHDLDGDGLADLLMKFKTEELVAALELEEMLPGDEVPLVISGTLVDGSPFSGQDCMVITGGRH